MKVYAPGYYRKFKCIASECKKSCCIGWEIDVDDNTYKRYCDIKTDFGKKIISNIDSDETGYHFRLEEGERCPFLREDNLCDIIINIGEDYLCNICADHPRYRNFYSNHIEIGLGLCCEAAADIILNENEKTEFECILDDGNCETLSEEDEYFLNLRQKYLDILQDSQIPIEQRFTVLLSDAEIKLESHSVSYWAKICLELEQLDDSWVELLKKIENCSHENLFVASEFERQAEKISVYFVMRHLADGRCDMTVPERLAFSVLSTLLITSFASVANLSIGEVARMYSSEIEYSDENTEALIEMISEMNYENM